MKQAEDFPAEAWGLHPPEADPTRYRPKGPWTRIVSWSYDGYCEREDLAWYREYIELDGHEECCGHSWPIVVLVPGGQVSWKPK